MSPTIRPATAEDAAGVLAVQGEAAAERWTIVTQPEEMRTPEQEAESLAKLAREGGVLLVAEEMGRIVGICGVARGQRLAARHVAEVGLTVAAARRGQGVGRALMEAAEAWAAAQGVERLVLSVFAHNDRARRLYERLGYQVEGVRRGQFRLQGKDVDEVLMAKRLEAR